MSEVFNPYKRNEEAEWSPERTEVLKNLQYDPSTFRMQQDSRGWTEVYSGDDRVGRFGGPNVLGDFVSSYTQGWQQKQDTKTQAEQWQDTVENYQAESPDAPELSQVVSPKLGDAPVVDPETGRPSPFRRASHRNAFHNNAARPQAIEEARVKAATSSEEMAKLMQGIDPITGQLSPEASVIAANMDPSDLAQLGLSAHQLGEAQRVEEVERRKLEQGELISGPTVDMGRVEENIAKLQAAEATPSEKATVQGQLEGLMQQFDQSDPPPWAAGAMRAANAQLAQRGLSASSMAGQAVVQAAMESALPIAMADAQTFSQFETQNLSNRQQTAMFGAQQRASFLGVEFDQAFQTRVANAARISDIADMNFTSDVQIALENARMAQTVDLANLDAKNAKLMADAAAMSQLDMANLSSAQQARVQNAQSFLQMDMANFNAAQQTNLFKAQERANALLSDTAEQNAARQFNATSQNQTNQFMANLSAQTSQFNAQQRNATSQFNAGQSNALEQFNTQVRANRQEFNSSQAVAIAQSNAQLRQQRTLAESSVQMQANLANAQNQMSINLAEYNNLSQARRDAMNYAYTASESAKDRATQIVIADIQQEGADRRSDSNISAAEKAARQERNSQLATAVGGFIASLFG